MKKGFTLLELIVVIIIIGILATLGFVQYTKIIEKGRVAEANSLLGNIRSLETAYRLDHTGFGSLAEVGLADIPGSTCNTNYYFQYSVDTGAGTATATRCTTGGKTPDAATSYNIVIDFANGTITGAP
jgi:type IV pilus assembly protein PilE